MPSKICHFDSVNLLTGAGAALVVSLAAGTVQAAPIFFEGTGLADVGTAFADMQAALGDPNNGNAPGPIADGRRQINWDAGIVPFDMPRDFFNNPIFPPTRGAEFTTGTNEFRVSNDGIDNEFDTFNSDNPNQFTTFSSPRLFSPLDTNIFEINFFVPATNIPATVAGFGAIFTDVDLADTTLIEWFDVDGNVLGSEFVMPDPEGLSFLGATFDDPIASVQITLGNAILGSGATDGGGTDLVVLDDFIYGEPQAVPSPATLSLLLVGGAALIRRQRRLETV